MLKILKTDLYRCFCNLVFPLSVLGVTFVCLLSECYVDETEKSYTVLSVILARQQMAAVIQQLNYFEVWEAGIGQWAHIILPFLLTASYLSYFSEERSSGVILFYQIRSSKWTYCIAKTLCSMLLGGVVLTAGYLLYGCIVVWNFGGAGLLWQDVRQILSRTAFVFIYGMLFSIYGYAVSVFFRDKNILMTFPMMLSYLFSSVLTKIQIGLINHEKWDAFRRFQMISMENIIGYQSIRSKLFTVSIFTGVYILCLLFFVKRTGKHVM